MAMHSNWNPYDIGFFPGRGRFGQPISEETLYVPRYAKKCEACSYKLLCNGCFNCGACEGWSD